MRVHALGKRDVVPGLQVRAACRRGAAPYRSAGIGTALGNFLLENAEILAFRRNRDDAGAGRRCHSAAGESEHRAKSSGRWIPFPTDWHIGLILPGQIRDARPGRFHPLCCKLPSNPRITRAAQHRPNALPGGSASTLLGTNRQGISLGKVMLFPVVGHVGKYGH